MFSVCQFTPWQGGTPWQVQVGVPHPRSTQRGTPSQVQVGVPHPRSRCRGTPSCWQGVIPWDTPPSRLDGVPPSGTPSSWMGGTTSQVQVEGYPIPGPDGGTPSSQWGVPCPRSSGGGLYHIQLTRGGTSSQVQVGKYPRVLPCPRLDGVAPTQDWMRYPPLIQDWMGYPPPPRRETDQHSQHLLLGGRYASCVHAGGLSCSFIHYSGIWCAVDSMSPRWSQRYRWLVCCSEPVWRDSLPTRSGGAGCYSVCTRYYRSSVSPRPLRTRGTSTQFSGSSSGPSSEVRGIYNK